jgi:acyl dehydratase
VGRGNPRACLYEFDVNYRGAIKLGDTVRTRWHVTEKIPDPHHKGFGVIKTIFQILNQEDVAVYDGDITTKVGIENLSGKSNLPLNPGTPWTLTESTRDTERLCYAEDYTPDGQSGETEGRTVNEADIVNFAGLTGDYNPQHVDDEFAGKSMFGERTAHGMLGFNIAFACWLRDWLQKLNRFSGPKSDIAGHLNDKICFLAPIKIGDTIRCRYKTLSARTSKSRPEFGLVTFGLQVINQRDEVVQEGSVVMMMPSSPEHESKP